MANLKVPYFKWRDGRPRWEPGPGLRRAGWRGRDLRDSRGEFLPWGLAIEAAQKLNEEVKDWREGAPRPDDPPKAKAPTVETLFEKYFESPDFQKLRASTQLGYRKSARAINAMFGDIPVRAVSRKMVKEFHWAYASRGKLAQANALVRVFRLALNYAELDLRWIRSNPAARLRLKSTPPRLVLWLPGEISELVDTADRLGLPSVADAAILALHTGQRQGDVLAMRAANVNGGRFRVATSKTGAVIDAPLTPQLERRLKVIAARKKQKGVISPEIVVTDEGGAAYNEAGDYFRHQFIRVRRAAAVRRARRLYRTARRKGSTPEQARKQAGLEAGTFISKQFLDLRDTAVTRLAEAGCKLHEIMAITGHSSQSIHQILKHYLVLTGPMADKAIAKLVAHLDATGAEW